MLVSSQIDLRDTHVAPAWHGRLSPIWHRGFSKFEVVDAEISFAIGRTTLVVTIMDDLGDWYEVAFVLESTSDAQRRAGTAALDSLCRAVGLRDIEDAEHFIGRTGAFRVASAAGDIHFRALSALDA